MKRAAKIVLAVLVGLALLASGPGAAAGRAQAPTPVAPEPFPFSDRYPAQVVLQSPADLAVLVRLNLNVDDVRPQNPAHRFLPPGAPFETLVATVYVNQAEAAQLAGEGLTAVPIPNESLRAEKLWGPGTEQPYGWPTYDQWVTRMQTIATAHPNLVRMISIGTSVQGRQLWWLKITDNPDVTEDEPEFRWVSTMHGNEPVGAEMCLRLADLLTDNYGLDPVLTELVNEEEIWLFPLFNPDGYMAGSRWNAHGQDLNRNFPDRIIDPIDDPAGREPETQATMYFGYARRFVLGANFHTGALVVNYPYDSVPWPPDYAPDDELFYQISVGYSSRNPMIRNGGFPQGVTRGWEWYQVNGGLQDWAYVYRDELHVTIEMSEGQPPPYNQMDTYWADNKDAMLWWMQQPLTGVRGLVTDAVTGAPLDATVDVLESSKPIHTDPSVGDYHRILLPGTYTVRCSAEGYLDQEHVVTVAGGPATVQNCAMSTEAQATMHVAAIKIQYRVAPNGRYVVTAKVRILDDTGSVVPSAMVSLEWTLPDGSLVPQQAATNLRGTATFRVKTRQTGTFQACVTGVVKAGYVYDPDQNQVTCKSRSVP